MRLALFILSAVAAALAWIIARKRPEHRPIALALSIYFASSVVRAVLLALFPPNFDPTAPPHVGAARLAVFADRALFIAWPCAIAAAALRVLARRGAWPVAIGYAVAVAVLVVGYPALRFAALRQAYLAIELSALAVGVVAVGAWWRRGWRSVRAGERQPLDISGRAAAVLVLGHFAAVVSGPYRVDLFGEGWALAQLAYILICSAVILLQFGEVLARAER